jgi:hypothetical protein
MFLVNYFFYFPLLLVVWQCITVRNCSICHCSASVLAMALHGMHCAHNFIVAKLYTKGSASCLMF